MIRSDGQFIRDYFYVEDGAAAYMLLAEKLLSRERLRGKAFNFSNEIQVTVVDLVEQILQRNEFFTRARHPQRSVNEIRHQYLSACRARTELGWSPLFSLDEGLSRTISWYQEYLA